MKKSTAIIGLIIAISISAFGFVKWSDSHISNGEISGLIRQAAPEFIYDIDCKYGTSITREKLHQAKSVQDILPQKADWSTYPIHTLHVTLLHDSTETSELGENLVLTQAQTQLLRSTDYSDSFRLKGKCQGKHKDVPDREDFDLTYYITVTPEIEAQYHGGEEALIDHLRENSISERAIVNADQLERGEVIFTVSKNGTVENVELASTSGYPSIDRLMVKLITGLSGKWKPAENTKGEKVEQELVFSFGKGGC